MKKIAVAVFTLLFVSTFLAASLYAGQKSKGIGVVIRTESGQKIRLYKESHALLIGAAKYTAGWPKLECVPEEMNKVETALKKQGFRVKKIMNPTGRQLKSAFEDFIDKYGYDEDNRLLFFFSGHGYSRKGGKKGYLVPVDAPDPRKDKKGFMRKALGMNMVLTWSRQIETKHALFLFDSCFSGTIFKAKALPKYPPHISDMTSRPVRQFISAGSAGEEVPASSVFIPSFIRALKGEGDLNEDGYVTGTEMGMYLHEKVLGYETGQTPQYGKIKDPDLDEGDFVFQLASSSGIIKDSPSKRKKQSTLSIKANVSGAKVLIDGKRMGTTNLYDKEIAPGEHRIRVEKEGYEPYRKTVRLKTGRSLSLTAWLEPEAPAKSSLYVDTRPSDARIRILNITAKFHQGIELDPGRYHLEVSARGYETYKEWISLDEGEDGSFSIRLKKVVSTVRKGEGFSNSMGMEFKYIEPGSFMMGSPSGESGRASNETRHRVTLTRGYYLQTTEVTQGQWEVVMGTSPWSGKKYVRDDPNCPAVYISWDDCKEFIRKLNNKEGTNKYRLPTEAEWEYACRAGSTTRFSFGNSDSQLGDYAWHNKNAWDIGNKYAHRVGTKKPNFWGLYDMHGNVWEWCQDWYGDYASGAISDPGGSSSGSLRVLRGGGWFNFARVCRSAYRNGYEPGGRSFGSGFRLASSPGQ